MTTDLIWAELTVCLRWVKTSAMADDPPQNNLHRYWHKKPPDAPAPAEDSTLGMLSSRLVSFSCCHSPIPSNSVDLFVLPGASPEEQLLHNAGAPAAPPDESTPGILSLYCACTVAPHMFDWHSLFDPSFAAGPFVVRPGGEVILAARGEHHVLRMCVVQVVLALTVFAGGIPPHSSLHRSSC